MAGGGGRADPIAAKPRVRWFSPSTGRVLERLVGKSSRGENPGATLLTQCEDLRSGVENGVKPSVPLGCPLDHEKLAGGNPFVTRGFDPPLPRPSFSRRAGAAAPNVLFRLEKWFPTLPAIDQTKIRRSATTRVFRLLWARRKIGRNFFGRTSISHRRRPGCIPRRRERRASSRCVVSTDGARPRETPPPEAIRDSFPPKRRIRRRYPSPRAEAERGRRSDRRRLRPRRHIRSATASSARAGREASGLCRSPVRRPFRP